LSHKKTTGMNNGARDDGRGGMHMHSDSSAAGTMLNGDGGGGVNSDSGAAGTIVARVDATMVAVFAAVERVLPRTIIPQRWTIISAFPLSSNGKIDRMGVFERSSTAGMSPEYNNWRFASKAKKPRATGVSDICGNGWGGGRGVGGGCEGAENGVPDMPTKHTRHVARMEAIVAKVWAAILDINAETIEPDHTLFELGGDSLTVLRASRHLHEELGLQLDLKSKAGKVGEIAGVLSPRTMMQSPRLDEYVRCAFFDRDSHSMMPLVPHACSLAASLKPACV
jgi:acyl carrier protein